MPVRRVPSGRALTVVEHRRELRRRVLVSAAALVSFAPCTRSRAAPCASSSAVPEGEHQRLLPLAHRAFYLGD